MGDTYAKQVTFDDVIYNLWGMKEPNYLMRHGKFSLTSPFSSDIADGHSQDGYSFLRSPIHLEMSGILLAVHCPESCLLFNW